MIDESGKRQAEAEDTGEERLEMSVALLRSLVDECAFETRPDGGLTTTLTLLI